MKSIAVFTVLALLLAMAPASFAASPAAGKQAVVAVKGLACPFCVHGLKKQLIGLPGARRVDVSLGKSEAVITFDSTSKVTDQQIAAAIRKAGFTPGKIEWRSSSGS
jgi:copper chaperone CopZ